jgi:amidase
VTAPNTRRLRISVVLQNAIGRDPDPEVRAAIEGAAALCRELGHDVREGRPQFDGAQFSADFVLLWAAGAAEVVQLVQSQAPAGADLSQLLEPLTIELAQLYQQRGSAALEAAIGRLRQVEARYDEFFSDVDVYLTPVLAKPPLPLNTIDGAKGMVAFDTLPDYVGYTPLENIAGAPAISLPLGWSSNDLPIGAHFSANKGQERTLLELAYELEQARPWASRKPPVNAG